MEILDQLRNSIRNINLINLNATFQKNINSTKMQQLTAAVQGLNVSNLQANLEAERLYVTPTNVNTIKIPEQPNTVVPKIPLVLPGNIEVKETKTIPVASENLPEQKIYTREELTTKNIKKEDLQNILKGLNARISGNKPELVDRILDIQNKLYKK